MLEDIGNAKILGRVLKIWQYIYDGEKMSEQKKKSFLDELLEKLDKKMESESKKKCKCEEKCE